MSSHTGRCLCGNISYEFTGNPAIAGVCHCKNCQRQAGSAFSTLYGVPAAAMTIKGETTLYVDGDTDSGNQVERHFCGKCGSPIYSRIAAQPDMLFLKTGTLDNTDDFAPQFQVWCDSKQNWVTLPEGVPAIAKGS
ncbi:MAG: GFA family protein [Pseudomonadales bacterium]|nr:GFA family protein [Pseudomonadales bacterium]